MADIEYFFSVISSYTYLAGDRPAQIAARHGKGLIYRPLDIGALFERTGGVAVGARHPSRQAYRLADLDRQARRAGMPINLEPAYFPANAAPASYAIIAAQDAGGGDMAALVAGLSAACWARQENVADDAVIRGALQAAGFDPALADKGLFTAADSYTRNLEAAVAAGVFGAPSWVTPDGALFWGQDRLDDLDGHLAGAV